VNREGAFGFAAGEGASFQFANVSKAIAVP